MNRGFGSDNHATVFPAILNSLLEANQGHAPSYGTDGWTQIAGAEFKKHFGPNCESYFVFNGTAANVLSLKILADSYQSILCSDVSHIHVDECSAPEVMAQTKLIAIPSINGKLKVADLEKAFIRRGDQHFSQVQVLSLTQPTELGSLYSISELKELCSWAKSKKLFVHMDGARIANAAIALNLSFKEFTTDVGVDIVSFGGTKNGLMFGEAVLILNPQGLPKSSAAKYFRKQMGQLPSKTRFIAAQFSSYFRDDNWKTIAGKSLKMAKLLESLLIQFPEVKITQPVQSNAVFAIFPRSWIKPLKDHRFFYVWDENTFECRLMMSWDTQEEDILSFIDLIKELR